MSVTIWHNPRCSKSRQTLALLEEKGIEPTVRQYLNDVPTPTEIADALRLLDMEPRGLMRTGEEAYKAQNLRDVSDETALIMAMHNTPKLIERPLVIVEEDGKRKAILGRPPESVLEIL